MIRVKTVKAEDCDSIVEVTIRVKSRPGMPRGAPARLAENLASGIMSSIAGSKEITVPLSKIRVR